MIEFSARASPARCRGCGAQIAAKLSTINNILVSVIGNLLVFGAIFMLAIFGWWGLWATGALLLALFLVPLGRIQLVDSAEVARSRRWGIVFLVLLAAAIVIAGLTDRN